MAASFNLEEVGRRSDPYDVVWTPEQAILYALGVGAGQDDPQDELSLTTQDSEGMPQEVLPTFAVWISQAGIGKRVPFGTYDRGTLVHAEQSLRLHRPLPPSGSARATAVLEGIYDKGSGALVDISVEAVDPVTSELLWVSRLGYFIRGAGGFGGPRGPQTSTAETGSTSIPERPMDTEVRTSTRPDQALLYRLSGDFNPLHSDPAFARRAGFERPILHGLCTYGVIARTLTRTELGGDQTRFREISARFSKPVLPGEQLRTEVWREPGELAFRTHGEDGRIVLDRGRLRHD
ncbi:MaoC/PaaZ C-terminal domain-containing protein [Streptomyces sp. NPDC097610]|uniref:MaoC/PaaZ C-terminal domain-containing protein n=1 Tax=Streptomyces sp. NPDC097610 TaxID=3157227 RepID=UPI00331859EC